MQSGATTLENEMKECPACKGLDLLCSECDGLGEVKETEAAPQEPTLAEKVQNELTGTPIGNLSDILE